MSTVNNEDPGDGYGNASPSPLVAAYRVGRSLGRLKYSAFQLWLGYSEFTGQTQVAFDDLRAAARQIVDPDHRDALQAQIEQALHAWQLALQSEWRAELLDEMNSELEHEAGDLGGDLGMAIDSARRRLLSPVEEMIAEIRQHIEAHLDTVGRMSVGFGICVEMGLCKLDFLEQIRPAPVTTTGPATSLGEIALRNNAGVEPTGPSFIADCRDDLVLMRPTGSWLADLQQRWGELGFDNASLPEIDAGPVNAEGIVRFVHDCDAAFMEAAELRYEVAPPADQFAQPGYLGLVILSRSCQVRREGVSAGPVELTRLSLALMREFVRNGTSYTSRARLRGLWVTAGIAVNPSDGTIDNEITQLRHLLSQLRIGVENRRRVGWRLISGD